MKKVLIMATVYSHIGQFHQPLIDMLKENDYEVHICGYNNLNLKDSLTINNVDKKYELPFSRSPFSLKNLKCYRALKKIMKDEKYDIIHCNTPVGGVLGRLMARKYRKNGTKVFYTAHGFHFYKGASIKNWIVYYPIEKILSRYTDVLITINKEDYELSKAKFKKCKEFLYINGVGVNEKKYNIKLDDQTREKYINELNINTKDFNIICIGELNTNKNQDLAINAMKTLIVKYNNIKLWLLGNGPKKDELQQKIAEYKLENNVKLLGYRRDIPQLLQLSHIGLSCSLREGLGLNLIEELIAELPIIGVKNRGHEEIIINNYNGYMIENSVEELVDKIELLIEDKNVYNKLKSNCYNSAEKFFTSKSLEKLKKIYNIKK